MLAEDGAAVEELLTSELNIRCAEFHDGPGGTLPPGHFDKGSVVTVDVMLSDDFEGGDQTREVPRVVVVVVVVVVGDGKPHFSTRRRPYFPVPRATTVAPVLVGSARCLLEFWKGEEKGTTAVKRRAATATAPDGFLSLLPGTLVSARSIQLSWSRWARPLLGSILINLAGISPAY